MILLVFSHKARIVVEINFFTSESAYGIMLAHGISHSKVYNSVWEVVDAVNACEELALKFPTTHQSQREVVQAFKALSSPGFDNCAGCIDGMLVWTQQPTEKDCKHTGIGGKAFFCCRKNRFGLNMQAVCDSQGRFLGISIMYPASALDYLSFFHHKYTANCNLQDFLLMVFVFMETMPM